jgi:uncharacterized membrane protein YqaE (UPF0057 family)
MAFIGIALYNGGASSFKPKRGEYLMDNKVLQVIVALFIPPLAVYMKKGTIDSTFWINLVLTFFFFVPGVLHALYVVLM